MMCTLGADPDPEERVTFDDAGGNQLATSHTGKQVELDYVLVRSNGCALAVKLSVHHFQRPGWDKPGDRVDLSYRYAVSAEITLAGS